MVATAISGGLWTATPISRNTLTSYALTLTKPFTPVIYRSSRSTVSCLISLATPLLVWYKKRLR